MALNIPDPVIEGTAFVVRKDETETAAGGKIRSAPPVEQKKDQH